MNPTSINNYPFADWKSFDTLNQWTDRGINYQYTPVISGLGTYVAYPSVSNGWCSYNTCGPEYTTMPELDNSLIYYREDGYDSGMLSQELNGKDEYLGDEYFDGEFEGNYVDGVWISNPSISEHFEFSKMYYESVHNVDNTTGLHNYYDGSQKVLVKNRVVDYILLGNLSTSGLTHSGILPYNYSFY